jgi:hypothetical protein
MATPVNKTQHPAYRNQPLGPTQIRLLSLQTTHLQHVFPWIPHRLELVITRHNLEDEPDFAAVSYVWGNAPASVSIPCNGSSILITPNVYEMLERFRLFGLPVWIDAICINQEDVEEKRTQIPLMQKIYRNASNVYVWMGSSSPAVRDFMLDFGRVVELSRTWTPQLPTGNPDWRGEDWPDNEHQFWGGAHHILRNDWFKRLWTFQEIVLAKRSTLFAGSLWINGDDFFDFVGKGIYEVGGYLHDARRGCSAEVEDKIYSELAFETCAAIVLYSTQFRKDVPTIIHSQLAHVISGLRKRSAKEKVDRVWAILGLLDEILQDRLKPMVDYSEPARIEYWRTYIQFAKAVFVVGQSLVLFDICPCSGGHVKIPSWCPDLSSQPESRGIGSK